MPLVSRLVAPAIVVLSLLAGPVVAGGWVTIARDNARQVQIDRDAIIQSDAGTRVAWARMLLGEEEAGRLGYVAVHALNRYDCRNRSFMPVRRRYLDARSIIVREEEVADQTPRQVAPGGVDDRLWREVCRPPSTADLMELALEAERMARAADEQTRAQTPPQSPPPEAGVERSEPASGPARLGSEARREALATRTASRPAAPDPLAPRHPPIEWSYEDLTGPEMWGRLRPDWTECRDGRRQSPIDLHSGLAVNLEAPQFDYRPSYFRVIDTGRLLRIHAGEGLGATLRGERYELVYIEVHRPGEARVDGRIHDLSVDLHHRAPDGRMAVVSVQFEAGNDDHPVLAEWLASLPLERGGQYAPDRTVDLSALIPAERAHYLYSGSLTVPPCTEGVLRVVFKQPMQLSWEQLGVIARLHPPSARPLQPTRDRRVLELR
ncbi:carbonic anhydrase [Pseudazoarcus pumilus]|nr:surface-adhesin E family protein [Pseudazoarcus pumilus]